MAIWRELGFRSSPYGSEHLPASEEGERLLVGRDAEISQLLRFLRSTNRHATVEGDNGVGKTSLVNVACFRAGREFIENRTRQLLVPLRKTFQLTPDQGVEGFRREVLFEIAGSFIARKELLRGAGLTIPNTDTIDAWLNAPILRGGGGGVTVLGVGGNATATQSTNNSAGFTEAGFAASVDTWLRDCFPTREHGAFVAVIDNLELLETSATARALLEGLRDSVLSQRGIRWVLCGARGIVRTAASSPRLEGFLGEPIEIPPLADAHAPELIARRIDSFRLGTEPPIAPVDSEGFKFLYDVLHSNLRNALRYSEDFSLWFADQNPRPSGPGGRLSALKSWVAELAKRYLNDTISVKDRAWKVFDDLVAFGGSCSPSDHEAFGYDSTMALRPQVKSLEDAQLVLSTREDADQRRKTISITPKGWLVHYARKLRQERAAAGPPR
jgi:hypothetical protein